MVNLPMLEEVGTKAEFLSICVGYREGLLFPLDEGLDYIKSLRGCLKLESEGYGDEKIEKITRFSDEIKVRFLSKQEVQELIASQELLLRGSE